MSSPSIWHGLLSRAERLVQELNEARWGEREAELDATIEAGNYRWLSPGLMAVGDCDVLVRRSTGGNLKPPVFDSALPTYPTPSTHVRLDSAPASPALTPRSLARTLVAAPHGPTAAGVMPAAA